MTLSAGIITVGTAPSIIDGTYNSNFKLTIHNNDNTDAVYLGGPDVTVATGLPLGKEQTIQFQMNPVESIYAISAKAGHTISYIRQV